MTFKSRFSRREKLLRRLDLSKMKGLEIGALNAPLLKSEEANVKYVDHVDLDDLKLKYADDENVNINDLVALDAIWGDRSLPECFPREKFDFVVASHVIEHVPNLVGWLDEVHDVLTPDGLLILAIPDRRYTFDVLRRETALSEVINNHVQKLRRPSPGQVFDALANAVDFEHMEAWFKPPRDKYKHFINNESAFFKALEAGSGAYVDAHCSVFTAFSLLQILHDLLALNLLKFGIKDFHVAPEGSAEMILILTPLADSPERGVAAAQTQLEAFLRSGVDSEGLPLLEMRPLYNATSDNERNKTEELHVVIEAMKSSTSWKLTSPVRACKKRLLRLAGRF